MTSAVVRRWDCFRFAWSVPCKADEKGREVVLRLRCAASVHSDSAPGVTSSSTDQASTVPCSRLSVTSCCLG